MKKGLKQHGLPLVTILVRVLVGSIALMKKGLKPKHASVSRCLNAWLEVLP